MNILITQPQGAVRDSFFSEESINMLREIGSVSFNENETDFTKEEFCEKIKDIDILVTGWWTPKIEGEILDSAKRLKIIAHTAGTVAPIAGAEVYERGIRVLSGNDAFSESVAEGTLCYILSALRRIVYYANLMSNGGWKESVFENKGLFEKTIGIIGFGAIAKHLIEMLKPFRVNVLVSSPSMTDDIAKEYGVKKASLDEVFEKSDIISVHCALNEQTHHFIDERLLSKIRDGALFVNTARGAVVCEKALNSELAKNRFFAVLDVFEEEPLPADSPLRGLENATLIPHMGGPTIEHRHVVTKRLIGGIEAVLRGEKTKMEITAKMADKMSK